MLPYIMFGLMILSLCILLYYTYNPNGNMYTIVKTCTSILFIATCISSYFSSTSNPKYFLLILIALVFSLFGDVFLAFYDKSNPEMKNFFVLGVISFAIAHIFFSFGFIVLCPFEMKSLLIFIILSIASLCFLKIFKGFDFKGMFNLVAAYDVIICFMVTNALSLFKLLEVNFKGTILIIIGAALFFISDLILSFIYFTKKHPKCLSGFNLSTYYIGQGLIALSLIANL